MKKKAKIKTQQRRLRKIAKVHAIFSVALFSLYIISSVIYSPEFLLSDVKHKFSALADETVTIVARVLDSPIKPIVSGTASCVNNVLEVSLSWPSDLNSQNYSITRDGTILASGITFSNFKDTFVNLNTQYSYIITAHGEMGTGFAISDPIIISTPQVCGSAMLPKITISAYDVNSDGKADNMNERDTLRPLFTGTTNIANAIIKISIPSSQEIIAETSANQVGYWSWLSPVNISPGTHTIYVTAIDPLDETISVSTFMNFNIAYLSNNNDDNKITNKKKQPAGQPVIPTQPIVPEKIITPIENQTPETISAFPFDYTLTLEKEAVFQGKDLPTFIKIELYDSKIKNAKAKISYKIFDQNGKEILNFSQDEELQDNMIIQRNIFIPNFTKQGNYKLQLSVDFDKYTLSKEQSFVIAVAPLINLGGGIILSYPDIISKLGTISLILLLLLLFWLILFSREYWLYLHALRHITEKNLNTIGSFGKKKRKEVSR